MADLESDNVTIGIYMRSLVKDRKKCEQMEKDVDFATREFGVLLDLPPGHKVRVHLDEKNITHVIIPLAAEMAEAEAEIGANGTHGYPRSYVPDPLAVFKASQFPDKAFSFRVGEYTMRRCKG